MANRIIDAGDHLRIALNGRDKFPGGSIEVSRCSDGSYWAHFQRVLEANEEIGETAGEIIESRIDYTPEAWARMGCKVPPLPDHADIQHIAVKIAKGGAV